jgi:hypothetical protein
VARIVANHLKLKLAAQTLFVNHLEAIGHTLRQKLAQATIYYTLLIQIVGIPIDHLVHKTFAASAHKIPYAGRAHTNARGSDRPI